MAVATVACAAVAFASTAPPTPSVSIVSPANQAQVSGSVLVTVQVTAPAGAPVTSLDVNATDSDATRHTFSVPLAPGECDTGCTKSFTLDTTRTRPTAPGAANASVYPDGGLDLRVTAHTAQASGTGEAVYWIDNNLPLIESGPGAGRYIGGKSVQVSAVSLSSPARLPISDVQLILPGTPAGPVHLARVGTGDTWQGSLGTGNLSTGTHPAELVAVDSAGHSSTAVPVQRAVEHGFTLSTVTSGPYLPNTPPRVNVNYTGWGNCPSAFSPLRVAQHLALTMDGTPWHSADLPTPSTGTTCQLGWDGNHWPLPVGHHTLAVTLSDTDGYSAHWSQQITVVRPLKITAPAATTLVAGAVFQPKITTTAQDGISHPQTWQFTLGTTVLARGQYPAPPALRWTSPVSRLSHSTFTLTLTSNYGQTTQATMHLDTRWLTSVSLAALNNDRFVNRGQPAFLNAVIRQRIGTTWSRLTKGGVFLEWRQGTGAWHVPPYVEPTQISLVTQRLYQPTCFRVVTGDLNVTFDSYFDSTSNTVCITPQ
jgi:hypothetical protein